MVAIPVPRDLTLPQPGSRTAYAILSAALGRCLRDLVSLPHADLDPATVSGYRALLGVVAALRRDDPGALASVVRRPSVGVWIRCLRKGAACPVDRNAAFASLVATLGTELAWIGALPRPLRITRFPARIVSMTQRAVLELDAADTALWLSADGFEAESMGRRRTLTLQRHDRAGSPYFVEIVPGLVLALVDANPLAGVEAHPDKHGNAIDLGGVDPDRWVASLREALDLVTTFLPEIRTEMDVVVEQVVPVGWDAERHLSASYQEAIGTIYASLHPQTMTMAEALIHEFSHNKLNALLELDPVLVNAFHPLFRSPVRPDPRPLHGILLAVHAFLPVARLYERMYAADHPLARGPDFRRRWREIIRGNHEGAEVLLAHAQATPVGAGLLDEIAQLDRHFQELVTSLPA